MSFNTFKYSILVLTALYGCFVIFNIWCDFVYADLFWKVSLTVGVVYVFLGVYYMLMHSETDKELEKKGYMSK